MRQIQNLPSTPGYRNASTCGFFARKGRCARGFRNLPHTSVVCFRKCGVKPRSADQTPVLRFRDLRFCCQKSGCARRFRIFPRTSGKRGNTKRPEAETRQISFGKQPLTRQPSSRGAIKIGDALRWKEPPYKTLTLSSRLLFFIMQL